MQKEEKKCVLITFTPKGIPVMFFNRKVAGDDLKEEWEKCLQYARRWASNIGENVFVVYGGIRMAVEPGKKYLPI